MKKIEFNRNLYYVWNRENMLLSNPSMPQIGYFKDFIEYNGEKMIRVSIPFKNEKTHEEKLFKFWEKV